jgi:hypothetical protein
MGSRRFEIPLPNPLEEWPRVMDDQPGINIGGDRRQTSNKCASLETMMHEGHRSGHEEGQFARRGERWSTPLTVNSVTVASAAPE